MGVTRAARAQCGRKDVKYLSVALLDSHSLCALQLTWILASALTLLGTTSLAAATIPGQTVTDVIRVSSNLTCTGDCNSKIADSSLPVQPSLKLLTAGRVVRQVLLLAHRPRSKAAI